MILREFFVRIMFEDKALQASVEEIFSKLNEVSVNQNMIGKIVNDMIKSRLQYDEIGKEITEQDELELEKQDKKIFRVYQQSPWIYQIQAKRIRRLHF